MATRKIPSFKIVTDYTQGEENTLAATLSGKPDGHAILYNTTLGKTRVWNGSAFATVPSLDVDGGTYSATPLSTVNNILGSYTNILTCTGSHTAAKVAGTYAFGEGDVMAVSGTGILYPMNSIYLAAADFPTLNGLSTKLRIRAQVYTNDVAPTGNLTFGLYPFTRPGTSGSTGVNIYTIGTVVSGSNGATFTTPAADLAGQAVGSDFAFPADGHYVICVVTTATIATNSHVHMVAQLQLRNA